MVHTVRFWAGPWGVAAVVAVGLALAACGGSAAARTSSASTSASPGLRGSFPGAEGTVVQVSAGSLTLASSSGADTTVIYTSSTPITETSTGSLRDITVGNCIVATGSKQSTGAVSVTSVSLSSETDGSCAVSRLASPGALPSARPSARPSFSFSPRARPSALPANFAAVGGAVIAVNGTSVTVKTVAGTSQTITVPTTVKVSMSFQGTDADLTDNACVLATGTKGASGAVAARSLRIVPPGPSGCFTGSSAIGGGFGAFGGFGIAGGTGA